MCDHLQHRHVNHQPKRQSIANSATQMKCTVLLSLITFALSIAIEKRSLCGAKQDALGEFALIRICSPCKLLKTTLHNKYLIEKQIGEGSQSVVYSASYKGQKHAVKCLLSKNASRSSEIRYLSKLDHPNIVKLVDFFNWAEKGFMVTELCETDLEAMLNSRVKIDVQTIYNLLLDAVIYLHQKEIYHRDIKIKLANILITSVKSTAPRESNKLPTSADTYQPRGVHWIAVL